AGFAVEPNRRGDHLADPQPAPCFDDADPQPGAQILRVVPELGLTPALPLSRIRAVRPCWLNAFGVVETAAGSIDGARTADGDGRGRVGPPRPAAGISCVRKGAGP